MGAYNSLGSTSSSGSLTPSPQASSIVSTVSAVVVPSNPYRKGLIMTNLGDYVVFLGDGMAAILGAGIAITPNSTFIMEGNACSINSIYAIAQSNTNLSIQEYI